MSKIEELFETYENIVPNIFEIFGSDLTYGEFDIQTKVKWEMYAETVTWYEGEDEKEYSNEIVGSIIEAEGYTLMYVDNGCGDNFWQIFNNSLKIN